MTAICDAKTLRRQYVLHPVSKTSNAHLGLVAVAQSRTVTIIPSSFAIMRRSAFNKVTSEKGVRRGVLSFESPSDVLAQVGHGEFALGVVLQTDGILVSETQKTTLVVVGRRDGKAQGQADKIRKGRELHRGRQAKEGGVRGEGEKGNQDWWGKKAWQYWLPLLYAPEYRSVEHE